MTEISDLTDLQVFAGTLLGESESLGERGMTGTACTILNRLAANLHWLGGNTIRGVCLQPEQYQCWGAGPDQIRVLSILDGTKPDAMLHLALSIASTAVAYGLHDITKGAISYYDSKSCPMPYWARGKTPCLVDQGRYYYDLKAVR